MQVKQRNLQYHSIGWGSCSAGAVYGPWAAICLERCVRKLCGANICSIHKNSCAKQEHIAQKAARIRVSSKSADQVLRHSTVCSIALVRLQYDSQFAQVFANTFEKAMHQHDENGVVPAAAVRYSEISHTSPAL